MTPPAHAEPEQPRDDSSIGGIDISELSALRSRVYLSKSDLVTDSLREMIVSGKLPSGTALLQREFTELFRVSSTPVREAFRRLESEGLVISNVHHGVTVAGTEAGQREQNYRILAALESLAGTMATPKVTEADLGDIEQLYLQHARCRASDPDLTEYNRRFHFRIYECADSPVLLSLMRLLWRSFPRGPQYGRPHGESVRQHRVIVDALRQRDEELVVAAIRSHVLGSIKYVQAGSGSEPS